MSRFFIPFIGSLTEAQKALAELFQVSEEILAVAGLHSGAAEPAAADDFATWIELLPQERRSEYLLKLVQNEQGLNLQLVRELRDLGNGKKKAAPEGERVPYPVCRKSNCQGEAEAQAA